MIIRIIIFLVVISWFSCTTQKTSNNISPELTVEDSIKKRLGIEDSIRILYSNFRIHYSSYGQDTEYVHVFIDYNKNSKLHDKLKKFRFQFKESDTAAFAYESRSQKRPDKIVKIPTHLLKKWIPVYKYENDFYVFMDCDFQVGFEITDTAAIFYNMDGAFHRFYSNFSNSEKSGRISLTDESKIDFELINEKDSIYKINSFTGCDYYTVKSNINKFPIIYVDCSSITPNPIKFEEVICK